MTYTEPQIPDTGRYPIGEAAKMLGIAPKTLRIKTEQGFIKCGFKRDTLRKFYVGSEIKRFWRSQA